MNGIVGDGVFENGQHKLTKPDRRRNKYKNKSPQTLAAGDFQPKYYDLKNTRAHKNVFHR